MTTPRKTAPTSNHHDSIRNAKCEDRITLWLKKKKTQAKRIEKKTGEIYTFDADLIANDTNLDTRKVGLMLRRYGGIDKQPVIQRRAKYRFNGEPISAEKYSIKPGN